MQKDGEDKPSKANDSDDNCDDSETSNGKLKELPR